MRQFSQKLKLKILISLNNSIFNDIFTTNILSFAGFYFVHIVESKLRLHCPKSSLGNILAQKISQPAWG
jgi:hypothetical protein